MGMDVDLFGKDPIQFLGKRADRHHICLVGLSSLCHGMCGGLASHKTDCRTECCLPSTEECDSLKSDYGQILTSLKRSSFRSSFNLTKRYRLYTVEKGRETIRRHAIDFISSRIAPAFPKNDGKQTPMKNHPVFIAQHATATCCRGCLQRWHGIEKGRALTDQEVRFVVELIMRWIDVNAAECSANPP